MKKIDSDDLEGGKPICQPSNDRPTCTICGAESNARTIGFADDHEYHTSPKLYEYKICSQCRSVAIDSKITSEEILAAYPAAYYSYHLLENYRQYRSSYWGQKYYNDVKSALLKDIKNWAKASNINYQDARILDYGAGDSFKLTLLEEMGLKSRNLVGFEPHSGGQDLGQNQFQMIRNSNDLDFYQNHFDIIIASHVIEHLEDPKILFAHAKRALKRRGILVIDMPTPRGWHFAVTKCRHWGGYHAPRHLNLLTAEAAIQFSRDSQFDLITSEYIDDSWIMAQTVNSIIVRAPSYIVPTALANAINAEKKEVPTLARSLIYGGFSFISKFILTFGGKSSVARLVVQKVADSD
ncbi:MAG: class I SAM-dependent methyltransferase [Pseudobdellovibrionaceae bacterium]|nr:MAG: class I SAM-dependent methyltransferase [Pseudobdellovibrionaceae bacterium]